jgi:ABC-type ATPase involved in cell division
LKFGLVGGYYLRPETDLQFVEVGVTMPRGTLHFISGRLAAGKTTLARELAAEYHGVLGKFLVPPAAAIDEKPASGAC